MCEWIVLCVHIQNVERKNEWCVSNTTPMWNDCSRQVQSCKMQGETDWDLYTNGKRYGHGRFRDSVSHEPTFWNILAIRRSYAFRRHANIWFTNWSRSLARQRYIESVRLRGALINRITCNKQLRQKSFNSPVHRLYFRRSYNKICDAKSSHSIRPTSICCVMVAVGVLFGWEVTVGLHPHTERFIHTFSPNLRFI